MGCNKTGFCTELDHANTGLSNEYDSCDSLGPVLGESFFCETHRFFSGSLRVWCDGFLKKKKIKSMVLVNEFHDSYQ